MDIELARTFLEIVSTGSFVEASERLHVAQTTVSARIRLLEQQLGRQLFHRNKSGASLTAAGEQFLRYAPTFVQLWQRARQQVAVPPGHRTMITVGSEVSLWQPLLLDWVLWMRASLRDVAVRVHVDVPQDLVNLVAAGIVDVAIMYAPAHRPGLKVDLLMEEELVLVTTDAGAAGADAIEYVHVDWGPDFAMHHGVSFPDTVPGLVANLGPLALGYVLAAGGSGYFRMQVVEPYLESGRLHLVPDAPRFAYPVYVVRSANADDEVLAPALAGLRDLQAISEQSRLRAPARRGAKGAGRKGSTPGSRGRRATPADSLG
jgi:DNA-binding transcriptional LysR family regulator